MSEYERLILINQFKILSALDEREAKTYGNHIRALESGYVQMYDWMTDALSPELDPQITKEVIQIFEMFTALQSAWKRGNLDGPMPAEFCFEGFDGNEESALFGFACFWMVDLGRHQNLGANRSYADLNSMGPKLGDYREQLKRWGSLASKLALSLDEALWVAGGDS